MSEFVERTRAWLLSLQMKGQGSVRSQGLLERIRRNAGLASIAEARSALRALKDVGEIKATLTDAGPIGYVYLHIPLPADVAGPRELTWRTAVDARIEPGANREAFHALYPGLADWPEDCFAALVETVEAWRRDARTDHAYTISARTGLASSKLIDALPMRPLQALGIDPAALPRPPPIMMVAGPAAPRAVVLVENPTAFEVAVEATADLPVAWICSYGYAATRAVFRERLASAVLSSEGVRSVVRSGNPPRFQELLRNPELLYWGDLDRSGLHIFHMVRRNLPHARLSALMAPMADLLRRGGGHPYCKLTEKADQPHWTPDDPDLATLATLCAERAVDQEWVSAPKIRAGCMKGWEIRADFERLEWRVIPKGRKI